MSGDELARERIERFFDYMIDGRGNVMDDGFSREEMIAFRDLVLKAEHTAARLAEAEHQKCTPEERDLLDALAKCGLPRFDSVYSNTSHLPFEPGDDRLKFEISLSEWRASRAGKGDGT